LGSFAPNGFLLASIPPHGNTFLSACSQTSSSTRPRRRASPAIPNAPVIELAEPPHRVFGKLLGLLISVGVAFLATRMTGHDLASNDLWFK
jgi:hypothetical protein